MVGETYESDEEARLEERKLLGKLGRDELYCDPEFGACGRSLYLNEHQPPKYGPPSRLVEWNRVCKKEIAGCSEPVVWLEAATGVVQGALSDRWFLSALGAISHSKAAVRATVVSSLQASRGLYTVKFYKGGCWRYVHVDDRMPCGRSGTLLYARSTDPNETWVAIAEKAYAKLHGCYEAIRLGSVEEAVYDVTGRPATTAGLGEDSWDDVTDLVARGCAIAVYDATPARVPLDPAGAPQIKPNVLLKDHPYVVLTIREATADATADYDALDVRMVQLLNPWQLGAWDGDWSPASPLWRKYAPIAAACATEASSTCTFWMEWQDLAARFDTLVHSYEHDPAGSAVSIDGAWVPGDARSGAGGSPMEPHWHSNPQFCFDVLHATRVCITLSQLDIRWRRKMSAAVAFEQAIGFTVHRVRAGRRTPRFQDVAVSTDAFRPQRTVTAEAFLKPGCYAVVPATLAPHIAAPFRLELRSDKEVTFHGIPEERLIDDNEDEDEPAGVVDPTSFSVAGQAIARLEEVPGSSELHALWDQASQLADFLATLSTTSLEIESKIQALETR